MNRFSVLTSSGIRLFPVVPQIISAPQLLHFDIDPSFPLPKKMLLQNRRGVHNIILWEVLFC